MMFSDRWKSQSEANDAHFGVLVLVARQSAPSSGLIFVWRDEVDVCRQLEITSL